jgi:hypothetical protein
MGDAHLSTGFVVFVVVGAFVWLRFYLWPKKSKADREKEERDRRKAIANGTLVEVPPLEDGEPYHDMFDKKVNWKPPQSNPAQQPMGPGAPAGVAPMGPSAPSGLSAPTPPVPFGGRVGPESLTGAMRQQSTEALQVIREHFPRDKYPFVITEDPNPDWDLLYPMAADLLGAIRWWTKVVSPAFNDEYISALLAQNPIGLISSCIDQYRKSVPPGPDLDQALGILGFYLRNIQPGSEYVHLANEAWVIAALSLKAKVAKEEQAAGAQNEGQRTAPSAPGVSDSPAPPAPPDPPIDGKFGPEYLTGALKQESEEALQLLHTYTDDAYRKAVVERTGNPNWAMYYAMAADWLGALRWYRKVVNPQFDDTTLEGRFAQRPAETTSEIMGGYRSLPPGPDRDQALKILGFCHQYVRTKLLQEVAFIMVRVLNEKAYHDRKESGYWRKPKKARRGSATRSQSPRP